MNELVPKYMRVYRDSRGISVANYEIFNELLTDYERYSQYRTIMPCYYEILSVRTISTEEIIEYQKNKDLDEKERLLRSQISQLEVIQQEIDRLKQELLTSGRGI